jgi:ABC-type xylose transport system substrate-binding protein
MALQARSPGVVNRGRVSVCVQAAQTSTKQRKGKVGFKWDPANARWVRDDRYAGLAVDESKTLITPKTGSAYQV